MTQMPAPPPPGPPSRKTIDFARPFTFVFEDPNWLPKVAIGGLMTLLAFLLIGIPFIVGYCARLARNVAAGAPQPLPEWDAWGEDFGEGLKLVVIALIWYAPMVLLLFVAFGGTAMLGAIAGESEAAGLAASGVMGFAMCLFYALILVIAVLLPAALTLAVMRRDFGSGFAFGEIFSYIRENAANYVLSILVYLVAGFLSQFGVILLCIGIVFTSFWSQLVSTHAFAETYRYSPVK